MHSWPTLITNYNPSPSHPVINNKSKEGTIMLKTQNSKRYTSTFLACRRRAEHCVSDCVLVDSVGTWFVFSYRLLYQRIVGQSTWWLSSTIEAVLCIMIVLCIIVMPKSKLPRHERCCVNPICCVTVTELNKKKRQGPCYATLEKKLEWSMVERRYFFVLYLWLVSRQEYQSVAMVYADWSMAYFSGTYLVD